MERSVHGSPGNDTLHLTLVDGHVHFHDCFDPDIFFDAAAANFEAGARALRLAADSVGCLILAECAEHGNFARFRDDAGRFRLHNWAFERTEENESLIACSDGGKSLILIHGRQLVTRERLEVLALGTTREFPDGLNTTEALRAARGAGAVVVIPWGFGKWWFGRRTLVSDILRSVAPGDVYLGDNGGRLRVAPEPALFSLARSKGIGILAGSDPLPFANHNVRAGSYGFLLDGRLDRGRPAESVKALIRTTKTPFRSFGHRQGIAAFCRNQVSMQLRERRRRRAQR
jgi:hypothetical protein